MQKKHATTRLLLHRPHMTIMTQYTFQSPQQERECHHYTNKQHTHTHKTQTRRENIQHHTHLISRSTIIIIILLPLFNDDITTPIIGYRIENTIETIISLAMHLILCLIADRMTYEDSRYTIGVQNLCLIVSLIRESRRYTCTRGKTWVLEKPGIMNDTGRARTSVCQC